MKLFPCAVKPGLLLFLADELPALTAIVPPPDDGGPEVELHDMGVTDGAEGPSAAAPVAAVELEEHSHSTTRETDQNEATSATAPSGASEAFEFLDSDGVVEGAKNERPNQPGRQAETVESSGTEEETAEDEVAMGLKSVLDVQDFYRAPTSPGSSIVRSVNEQPVELAEVAKFMSMRPLPNRMPWPGAWQKAFPVQCEQPKWLIDNDSLLLAVSTEKGAVGSVRATAVVSVLQPEADPNWGSPEARPKWALALLAATLQHLRPSIWSRDREKVMQTRAKGGRRKTFLPDNKRSMYRFTHVAMLDADAGFVNFHVDSIGLLAWALAEKKKDFFVANEDWLDGKPQELEGNARRANGGFVFAANTAFSRDLFTDMFLAHVRGNEKTETPWKTEGIVAECSSNEMLCLDSLMYGAPRAVMQQRVLLGSSIWWNRGRRPQSPHVPEPDGRLHLMHYMGMGGGREQADAEICKRIDVSAGSRGERSKDIAGVQLQRARW
eukprot:g9461.t1